MPASCSVRRFIGPPPGTRLVIVNTVAVAQVPARKRPHQRNAAPPVDGFEQDHAGQLETKQASTRACSAAAAAWSRQVKCRGTDCACKVEVRRRNLRVP